MKSLTTMRLTGAIWAGVLLWLFSANAFAAGTAAGTPINNAAIAGYSVGGVTQDSICSSPSGNAVPTNGTTTTSSTCTGGGTVGSFSTGTFTAFLVDDKIVLTVTTVDAADVTVTPGQTSAVLEFTVSNTGNAPQGINFSTVQEAGGTADPFGTTPADDFDPTGINVFVSSTCTGAGATGAAYNSGTDNKSYISSLQVGASCEVAIVANIPAVQVDADAAVEALVAQVASTGSGGYAGTQGTSIAADDSGNAWNSATQQNIFADAAGTDDSAHDGKSSSRDTFRVKSAKLTVTKTEQVVSDPIAGTCLTAGTSNGVNNGKCHAIPGAVIGYTITVSNSGSASSSATSVNIADAVPANETIVASTIATPTFSVADININGTIPSGSVAGQPNACTTDGTTHTYTGGAFTAGCSFAASTANATINTLQKGETFTVFFEATVN